jgi:RNase P/RNase MRP subunit POP5
MDWRILADNIIAVTYLSIRKMKSLKPSHRENKRYLLIKGKDADKETIEQVVLDFIGILGYAETCPKVIKEKDDGLVLAINRKSLDKVRTAFLVSNKELDIVKVSGSLSKVK